MEKTEPQEAAKQLIDKAAKTHSADEAMKFAQAALNTANAIAGLGNIKEKR